MSAKWKIWCIACTANSIPEGPAAPYNLRAIFLLFPHPIDWSIWNENHDHFYELPLLTELRVYMVGWSDVSLPVLSMKRGCFLLISAYFWYGLLLTKFHQFVLQNTTNAIVQGLLCQCYVQIIKQSLHNCLFSKYASNYSTV